MIWIHFKINPGTITLMFVNNKPVIAVQLWGQISLNSLQMHKEIFTNVQKTTL